MKMASENLWNNINHTNIHIIGVPEGEERGKGPQKIFEVIIAENFLNMGKEIVDWVQETQRVPSRINPRWNTSRHIVIKLTKNKRQIIKSTKGKTINNIHRNSHKVISWFLNRNSTRSREWHDIFKVMKGKKLQPRILYPERLSFRFDGEIKSLTDEQKLRVQHHQTSFTTNVKGTSEWKKKAISRNMKIMKWKCSLVQATIQKR